MDRLKIRNQRTINNQGENKMAEKGLILGVPASSSNSIDGRILAPQSKDDLDTSGTITLTVNDPVQCVDVDSRTQVKTVMLPATPSDNMQILIVDVWGNASGFTITINGNGKNINAAATTTIVAAYGSKKVKYSKLSGRWIIV